MTRKSVTYRGTVVELAEMGTWSYDEAALAERTVGITVGQLVFDQLQGGSKSALAFAVVSLDRAGVEFDPDTIASTPLDDLIVDFRGADEDTDPEELSEDGPPAAAADDDAETVAAAAAPQETKA